MEILLDGIKVYGGLFKVTELVLFSTAIKYTILLFPLVRINVKKLKV